MEFKKVENKLRVIHYPDLIAGLEPFKVDVIDEYHAYAIKNALADQHLYLLEKDIIQDYSNIIEVEMFEDGDWVNYYNDGLDWDEMEDELIESGH